MFYLLPRRSIQGHANAVDFFYASTNSRLLIKSRNYANGKIAIAQNVCGSKVIAVFSAPFSRRSDLPVAEDDVVEFANFDSIPVAVGEGERALNQFSNS